LARFPVKTKLLALLLFALLTLTACSRPAPVRQAPAKAAADATLQLAQNLEQRQRYLDSKQTYQSSLRQYRSFGDLRGEAYSLAGLARLAYITGNSPDYEDHRRDLAALVSFADPDASYIMLLLDLYVLQDQGNYTKIQSLAVDSYDYPLGIRMQVITHALQAESLLNPGFTGKTYKDLERLSNRYRRSLSRDFSADPGVLSAALYGMAYHSYLLKDYSRARKYISEAVDLDQRYENFAALAYDFWLRANIFEALGELRDAHSDYTRAVNIFAHFENTEMLAKAEAAIRRLQGD